MVVFTGKTVQDAIMKASTTFQKPEDALKVEVIDQPRRGFFGIGKRDAKIEATIKPLVTKPSAHPDQPAHFSGDNKPKKTQAPVGKDVVVPERKEWTGEGEDPAVIAARHEANVRHTRNAGQQMTMYLKKVFTDLGIKTEPEITKVGAHSINIDIKSPESGRVIGRHGRQINAMEKVCEAFMNYHGSPKTTVILDTSNYRKRREEALHKIAERSVTEVIATGQAVFLDPMPARERKQMHKELEGNDRVRTYSHGREPFRSIVIAPK
ncbi:MAG: RNA-binding cell elongation regulator Jag/EloR [Limosilactobacillus sp.]|uniref:RNA-binding cell elongation regulator Jag/EloR n=1 Tax=Limosilactobacillus sp. TaxID=2773925 RepID=UPI0026F9A9BF|nr:RNA-binding cell elongation regulator Jag/EloR [Limosilactobacillus sp.]